MAPSFDGAARFAQKGIRRPAYGPPVVRATSGKGAQADCCQCVSTPGPAAGVTAVRRHSHSGNDHQSGLGGERIQSTPHPHSTATPASDSTIRAGTAWVAAGNGVVIYLRGQLTTELGLDANDWHGKHTDSSEKERVRPRGAWSPLRPGITRNLPLRKAAGDGRTREAPTPRPEP